MSDTTAVVACFNYGAYLHEAVRSLLDQEGGAPHVVVVDDGSTDPATLAALDELPPEVELIRQANAGVAAARNAGIERASHRSCCASTPTTSSRPARSTRCGARWPMHPDASFAYGHHRYFGDWTATIRFPPYDPLRLLDRHLIGLTALTRREVFDDTGGFDPAFPAYEDWELWLNALAHGHVGVRVDAVTLDYRRHGESKLGGDRRVYRDARRRMHAKHASCTAGALSSRVTARSARQAGCSTALLGPPAATCRRGARDLRPRTRPRPDRLRTRRRPPRRLPR